MQVALGGFIGAQISQPETHLSEALGLLSAVFILFLTLRRWGHVRPAGQRFVLGRPGPGPGGLLSRLVFIPDVAPTLGTMLGLGVGIDYALFLLTRHRTLLHQGYDVSDAVGRTAGTAGAGMVFAGGTDRRGLRPGTHRNLLPGLAGYAAAIVVAIAVLASITLVPAILGVMKHRVPPKKGLKTHTDEDLDHTGWGKLADAVTSKPWRYAIGIHRGAADHGGTHTDADARHLMPGTYPRTPPPGRPTTWSSRGSGPGENGPFAVVTQMYAIAQAPEDADVAPGTDPRTQDPRLQNLQEQLGAALGWFRPANPWSAPMAESPWCGSCPMGSGR